MYRRTISLIIILTFLVGSFGCASIPEEHKGAATGAGVGAATGALAGALLGSKGSKTEMAVIGGLLGALAGGAIGHYAYDQKRTKEETAQKYDYKSSEGTLLRIEDVSVAPAVAKPGDKVEMKMTYAVLGAGSGKTIEISESREIRYQGELYGKPEVSVSRNDGTYTSSIPLILPSDAKKGKYVVTMTVKGASVSDSKEASFQIN
jgi:YMGG-like Gly-zipper